MSAPHLDPAATSVRRRAQAAERARRHRRRERAGMRADLIEFDEHAAAAFLIDEGRLTPDEALDARAVRDAISAVLAELWKRRHA
jgi:hypothetical protein